MVGPLTGSESLLYEALGTRAVGGSISNRDLGSLCGGVRNSTSQAPSPFLFNGFFLGGIRNGSSFFPPFLPALQGACLPIFCCFIFVLIVFQV